ncbi:unnamed protein product [Spirodela intermedia]|uniref:RING-CH-type domain-containing protein n=1 Tax=Spirodela intermedia TaxID=51605 RepID=A0A7I8J2X0_SPIIN|nr:unnamed protein product [Spirodela intermedia]CAA6664457.1 unnamed protein product [Spirodela intermedia]
MADSEESSSFLVPPSPVPEPRNEIDLEAGPDAQIQCRICLETEGSRPPSASVKGFIAPCKCKGTSKFVHRECLDHWRSVKEGFAFAHCTTCKAPYYLRVQAHVDRKWRTFKFRFFCNKRCLVRISIVQFVIASLGYLVYLVDSIQQYRLRVAWGLDSGLSLYYICGKILNAELRNDLAQPCRELCICCCQPGLCDCHLPGTLCMWTDCTACCEGCATAASECSSSIGAAGEAGLPVLFIVGLVEYVVEDVDGEVTDGSWCPPPLPLEHVQQLKELGLL